MKKLLLGMMVLGSFSALASTDICDRSNLEQLKESNKSTYRDVVLIKASGHTSGYLDGYFLDGEVEGFTSGYLAGYDLQDKRIGWTSGYVDGLNIPQTIEKFKNENNLISALKAYCN